MPVPQECGCVDLWVWLVIFADCGQFFEVPSVGWVTVRISDAYKPMPIVPEVVCWNKLGRKEKQLSQEENHLTQVCLENSCYNEGGGVRFITDEVSCTC